MFRTVSSSLLDHVIQVPYMDYRSEKNKSKQTREQGGDLRPMIDLSSKCPGSQPAFGLVWRHLIEAARLKLFSRKIKIPTDAGQLE